MPGSLTSGAGLGARPWRWLAIAQTAISPRSITQPYLDFLSLRASGDGLGDRITTVRASMDGLPFPPGSFDLIWAEGSIFVIGLGRGLSCWKRFLSGAGSMAITELVWFTDHPPVEVAAFMQAAYPP